MRTFAPLSSGHVSIRRHSRLGLLMVAAMAAGLGPFTSSTAVAQAPYGRPSLYRPRPVYSRPPAYRSYGPATYRPTYTYPPAYRTYRPAYTYPPAYWTYRPWYTFAPGFWLYNHQPGAEYRGTSLPNEKMPGFQLAW